mgnify:CR=1 FL=1
MNHFYLIFLCCLSIETIYLTNLFGCFKLITFYVRKSFYLITNNNISDHWKELVIPRYSFLIISLSSKILLTFIIIFLSFCFIDNFSSGLFDLIFSLSGFIEVFFVVLLYHFFNRKRFKS